MRTDDSKPCPASGLRVVITTAEAEAKIATCYKCLLPLEVLPILSNQSPRAALPWHFMEEEEPLERPAVGFSATPRRADGASFAGPAKKTLTVRKV
jgi:hypothetical protein